LVLALSLAVGTLIFLGLTAFFTGSTWIVNLVSHRHGRALSGLKGSLKVRPYSINVIQPTGGFEGLPEEWDLRCVRYFAFRLHNLAPYKMQAKVHGEVLRLGFSRKKHRAIVTGELDDQDEFDVKSLRTEDVWVILYLPEEADSKKRKHRLARFQISSNDRIIHFRRRVWLQPLEQFVNRDDD
jgi:hypothetical protein